MFDDDAVTLPKIRWYRSPGSEAVVDEEGDSGVFGTADVDLMHASAPINDLWTSGSGEIPIKP